MEGLNRLLPVVFIYFAGFYCHASNEWFDKYCYISFGLFFIGDSLYSRLLDGQKSKKTLLK